MPDLNLRLDLRVGDVCAAHGRMPARFGLISALAVNGYAPESMFRGLVEGRIRRKAARAQGPRSGLAPLSALVVDLTHAEMTAELWHGFYGGSFEGTLRELLAEPIGGYDLIALCNWWGPDGTLATRYVVSRDGIPDALTDALFGL